MSECTDLETIPQYINSCWFNAILMSSLYSQGSKIKVIKAIKENKKKNSVIKIIAGIIKNIGKKNKLKEIYKKIRPELLLLKILDVYKEKEYKENLKKSFNWYSEYINRFYRYIGVNCLDIIYNNNTNETIINFENKISYKNKYNKTSVSFNIRKYNHKKEEKEIKEKLKKVPEVLILYNSSINNLALNYYYIYEKQDKTIKDIYNLSNYNIKTSGIATCDNIIEFNGHKYKLDSSLINNYNDIELNVGHSICGITCNDNKYVYNGWTNKTLDAAIMTKENKYNYYPCSLMKFDWDIKKSVDFCINKRNCNLDFKIDKKDLCFNFNKGRRVLVYTRIDTSSRKKETLTTETFPSKISNIKNILMSFKDIKKNKNYTIPILIKKLKDININLDPNKNYDIEKLKDFYIKNLKEHYNLSSSSNSSISIIKPKEKQKEPTRLMIIEMIKKKYPDMKGLTAKRKDELIIILNSKELKEKQKEPKEKPKEKEPKEKQKEPTRLMIIEMIKKKYPDMKGLTAKRKDELIKILNSKS